MSNPSESDTNGVSMSTAMEMEIAWGTREELLLAFLVKRHGLKDWDTVAVELQARISVPGLTAQICKEKYSNLKYRFTKRNGTEGGETTNDHDSENEDNANIPWLEDLRQLRVAELRQEVHHSDISIEALQLKKKRLEERLDERKEGSENYEVKPDTKKEDTEEKELDGGSSDLPKDEIKTIAASEEADKENQSFYESHSMSNKETDVVDSEKPMEEVKLDLAIDSKQVREENSCDDSSDRNEAKLPSKERKADGNSVDLRDSMEESKEGSDVQSSLSLTRRRSKRGDGGEDGAAVLSPATTAPVKAQSMAKLEMLSTFLDVIRSHKHGSVFERRLNSQKTDNYTKLVLQHVDLETVQSRLDDGSYLTCFIKFYLDLLLIFSNAIVFFPRTSPESAAAHELRGLVLKELRKIRCQTPVPSSPDPAPLKAESPLEANRYDLLLLGKQKSSAPPIVVCRKGGSASVKASSQANKTENQAGEKKPGNPELSVKSSPKTPNEEDGSLKLKLKEKPVTGVRSMRRSNRGRVNNPSQAAAPDSMRKASSALPQLGSADKTEAVKMEKKTTEVPAIAKKQDPPDSVKKKKDYPAKGSLAESLKISRVEAAKGGRRDQQKKKVEEKKDAPVKQSGGGRKVEDNSPLRKSIGRPGKKGKEATTEKRKRDPGEGEGSSKRGKKRTKR